MQFQIISCKTLDTLLKKSNYLLIDLREKQDYEVSHIPNAIWYNWEKLEKEIDTLLNQLTYFPQLIILYCDHGNTSLLIARDLARNGYPVMSLYGGYTAWQKHKS